MQHVPKLQRATGDMRERIDRLREAILDLVADDVARGDEESKNVVTSAIAQAQAFAIVWCLDPGAPLLDRVDAHMTVGSLVGLLVEAMQAPSGVRPSDPALVVDAEVPHG